MTTWKFQDNADNSVPLLRINSKLKNEKFHLDLLTRG